MLEKTAAGLESCNLHRVLSPARRGAINKTETSRQRLRTGFWQHGASAIELSAVWPAAPPPSPRGGPGRGKQAAMALGSEGEQQQQQQQQQQVLQASAFLLEFLYPVATHSLLRRIYPNFPSTPDSKAHGSVPGRRHFTRSSPALSKRKQSEGPDNGRRTREEVEALMLGTTMPTTKPSRTVNPVLSSTHRRDRSSRALSGRPTVDSSRTQPISRSDSQKDSAVDSPGTQYQKPSSDSRVNPDLNAERTASDGTRWETLTREGGFVSQTPSRHATTNVAAEERLRPLTIYKAMKMAEREMAQSLAQGNKGSLSYLADLLSRPEAHRFDDLWTAYKRLGSTAGEADHGNMILYLSQSNRIVDAGRSVYLTRFVKDEEWSGELQAAVVLVHLRNNQLDVALVKFKEGLKKYGLSAGLDYILADALFRRKWATVTEAWLSYHHANASRNDVTAPTLDQLQQLPDMGKRYILYEKWLARNNLAWEIRVAHPEIPGDALQTLVTMFSNMALEHPCNARRALVILKNREEPRLYKEYLDRMTQRWYDKLNAKGDLLGLSNVYRTYRDLEGADFSADLLHKLFNYFYPDDLQSLELLYRDWQQQFGELDQRGFEKYLKLYARLGDVEAVKGLWNRYTQLFPDVLSQNMAFRSLLNVHAQKGDVKAVEAEMTKMKEQHNVTPDVDDWNMLLKCYVRADEYRETIAVFKKLRQHVKADSWSYVHLLSMTAKKGELEETVRYFTQLQRERVPVTKEMLLPLVVAYCKHGRYTDAEKALMSLAKHKIVSVTAWNEFLRNLALKTDMRRCQQLLRKMKGMEIPSNQDTHAGMLSAMVKANQPWSAYRYLKKASSDRLTPLVSEYFDIAMAGAVRVQEWDLVRKLQLLMFETGTPMTFNAHVSVVEAAHRAKASSGHATDLARKLPDYLRSVFQGSRVDQLQLPEEVEEAENDALEEEPKDWFEELQDVFDYSGKSIKQLSLQEEYDISDQGVPAPIPEKTPPKDGRQLRKDTSQVGRAIRLLIEMKDFKTADELLAIYLDLFPQFKDKDLYMPNDIASALMMAHFNSGDFEKVHSMWGLCFDHTVRKARWGSKVFIGHQYDLCRPFDVVIRAYREQADGEGLLTLIQEVTRWGFKFSQSNWTLAVRYLAELEEIGPAMSYCEKLLMPGWKGWGDRRVDKEERREYNDTRRLRATPAVVLALQREWLRMQGLAAWNGPISRLVQQIEQSYPKLYDAFASSELGTYQLRNKWVIDDEYTFEDSIHEMLAQMSLRDLSQFKIVLQGWLVQRHWISGAPASPFKRRVFDDFEGKTILRNLKVEELETLKAAVERAIEKEQDRRRRLGNRGVISAKEHMDEYHDILSGRVQHTLEARRTTEEDAAPLEPSSAQPHNEIVSPSGKFRLPFPNMGPIMYLPHEMIGPSRKLSGFKLVLSEEERKAFEKRQALLAASDAENEEADEATKSDLEQLGATIQDEVRRDTRKDRVDPRFEELYGKDYDPLDPNFDSDAETDARFLSQFEKADKDSLQPSSWRRPSKSEVDAMWSSGYGKLTRQAENAERLRLLREKQAEENHDADHSNSQ